MHVIKIKYMSHMAQSLGTRNKLDSHTRSFCVLSGVQYMFQFLRGSTTQARA